MEANNPDRAEDEAMNPQPGCSSAVVRPRRKPSAHMTPKRGQNKLMSLTQRFMGLVHQSPDGVVDVHSMAKALNAPVRRVYDITNVLEGVQLIEKKEKKQMQVIPSLRHKSLDEEILKLAEEEALLDKMIPLYQNKTQQMLLDPETSKYLYLTPKDLEVIPDFQSKSAIAVRAMEHAKFSRTEEGFQVSVTSEDPLVICNDHPDPITVRYNTSAFSSAAFHLPFRKLSCQEAADAADTAPDESSATGGSVDVSMDVTGEQ